MNQKSATVSRIHTGLFGVTAVSLVAMIIAFPDQAFAASLSGLTVWWEYVFPALLPFFILSELLLGFGVVHALGLLLEPLMRLLFRLPGAGGWAVAMSVTAGFPSGAKAAADLRRDGTISRDEGDRLLALSHLCSPIFVTSVIAVGFLKTPELGLPLVVVHLISALITGLLVGRLLFRPSMEEQAEAQALDQQRHGSAKPRGFVKLAAVMADAHRKDGRPLGRLLGDAVGTAVQSLLVIGGFMIVFSVLVRLLSIIGLTDGMRWLLQAALLPWGMPAHLAEGAVTALFEVHLGAYAISQSGDVTVWGAAMLSAVIAWGGLSIHAQVKSLISGTDLRYAPFLFARLLHAFVSILVTFALWNTMQRWFSGSAPAFAGSGQGGALPAGEQAWSFWPQWLASAQLLGIFLLTALTLSALLYGFRRAMAAFQS
jgi:sporulation integral membrane protein YlbJ